MPVVEESLLIRAPQQPLFDLAQDYRLRLKWDPFLRDMRFLDGAREVAALVLAIAGIGGDLLAESLYIGWLPADYDRIAPLARLLTGAWGNTLYTLSGVLLTLDSRWLRGPARACAWLIWAAGLALGGFCLAGDVTGMAASTALLFLLFCPWVAWVGFLDRRRVA